MSAAVVVLSAAVAMLVIGIVAGVKAFVVFALFAGLVVVAMVTTMMWDERDAKKEAER